MDPLTAYTQRQYFEANAGGYAAVLSRLQTLSNGATTASAVDNSDPLSAWARRISDAFGLEGTKSPTYVPADTSDSAQAAAAVDAAAEKPPGDRSWWIIAALLLLAWWLNRR